MCGVSKLIAISCLIFTAEIASSGAFTGAFMGFVNCPVELVKIQLQLQRDNAVKLYNGAFDATAKIYAKHNLRGLYRGLTINILRDMPSFATYFCKLIHVC